MEYIRLFWDYFMSAFTGKVIWVPNVCQYLIYTAQEFSLESGFVLCGSDRPHYHVCRSDVQYFLRLLVGRLRPSNPENPIADLVYIVNGRRGGGFGFPSCHAANSFGLAIFLICLFP